MSKQGHPIFSADFGEFRLNRRAGFVLTYWATQGKGDGRKPLVRKGRRNLKEYETALNFMSQLAFEAGIKPHEIILKE